MKSKVKAMVHPIRIRILQTVMNSAGMTASDISQKLPDIPQATLYRHINALLKVDIIEVVDENRVRGTIEKVYSVSNTLESNTSKEVNEASKEEHFSFFFNYLMGILSQYETYLQSESVDLKRDGVSYRQWYAYLSYEELIELIESIKELIDKAAENEPNGNRQLMSIANIMLPSKN